MYKVAIIEDNKHARQYLKDLIGLHYTDMEVCVEAFRIDDGIRKLVETPCDLVLMDIELPDGNGFDILHALRERQAPEFHLILLSKYRYPDYMIRGMNFKARHYLFKPIQPAAFQEALTVVREEMERAQREQEREQPKPSEEERLVLRLSDKTNVAVQKSSILYVTNLGNRSKFYTDQGVWETNKNIGVYEELLASPPCPFFRTHQSFIVNLSKIQQFLPISKSVRLVDGTELPVARRMINGLKEALSIV